MKLSQNFNDFEFFSKKSYDLIMNTGHQPGWHIDRRLVMRLQDIRHYFQKPVKINSGWVTEEENVLRGSGSKFSLHLEGKAADIQIPGVSSQNIFDYVFSKYGDGAIGMIDKDACHIDCRNSDFLVIIKY